ncbi:MAG: Cache 3/Cache 2 fusion domain-containing protein, partial [Desulfobacteraceae bacterium]
MIIRPFRDWRIRAKLISVTLLLVLLPLLCAAYLSFDRFGKALRSAAEEDLEHLVGNIYSMCKTQYEMVEALPIGVKKKTAHALKDEIKSIKVGDTGYVYIMDSKGTLRLHPAKEGENILHAKDSAGFEYIRAMITDAVELGEREVGTIRYPWVNPELGEKRPRQKINKYVYFRPWDWIIAAGSYEEEIYQSMY